MKRTTIFRERNGQLVVVREHLAKQPSGNAAQRKKAIRSGWHPEWVQEGRPALLSGYDINYIFSGDVTLEPQFPGGVSSTDDDLIPNEVHYVEPEFEEV